MNDQTVLNPALPTPRNDERTVLNREAIRVEGLRPGMRLKNGMTILERLDITSGEAELYLCSDKDRKRVLKHYRQQQSLKDDVKAALTGICSDYVARVYEVGTLLDRSYELDEYFPLGSLESRKLSYEVLRDKITPGQRGVARTA